MADRDSVVSMWWIEQNIIPNADAEGANPWDQKKDQPAYFL